MEALARDLDVSENVRFAGAVPQQDVVSYMHAADAFLAVADLSNVGNPLLEAMACGMCIVAVDAGDTRDLIEDGLRGRLVEREEAGCRQRAGDCGGERGLHESAAVDHRVSPYAMARPLAAERRSRNDA